LNKNQDELKNRIQDAKSLFEIIVVKDNVVQIIAEKCHKSFVAGHRADLALINGAIAHAALEQRKQVSLQDIEAVSDLALAHRIRSVQSPPPEQDDQQNEDQNQEEFNEANEQNNQQESPPPSEEMDSNMDEESGDQPNSDAMDEEQFDIGSLTLNTDIIETINDKKYRSLGSGRRSKTRTHHKHGHYVKVKLPGKTITDLALDATLRAAAPFQQLRERNGTAIRINRDDIRVKIREKRIGHTVLFLLDTSGSMGINRRMSEAKAAVFELLKESYKKRDTVGLMKFNQEEAELVLSPTRSLDLAHRCLKDIKTGGRTPLGTAIEKSLELMKGLMRKNNEIQPVIILMSDGKANQSQGTTNALQAAVQAAEKAAKEKVRFIVIDTETGFIRLGLAMKLANALNGEYYKLDDLKNIKEIINAR
jgi:magnesium chelatase subunit D